MTGIERHRKSEFSGLLDRSLRTQLRIFMVIFAIMVVLMIVHVAQDHLNPLWVLVGFIPGLALGFLLVRTRVLRWEPSEKAVVGSMDVVGAIILVAYIVFLFLRSSIIGLEIESAALISLIGLAITAGTMIGRVWFTLRGVRNILREAGLLPGSHSA